MLLFAAATMFGETRAVVKYIGFLNCTNVDRLFVWLGKDFHDIAVT